MKPLHTAMRGASLIEALVTMVILSLGLLGLANLQLTNFRSSQNSYNRSQATFLAYDIIDRMRVNRGTNASPHVGHYAVAVAGATPSGDAVATADVTAWKTALANDLPDGEGSITVTGTLVTVKVVWDDRRGSTAAGDPCYSSGTRKACFETTSDVGVPPP